jgi:sialate O-acetylesterase
MKKKLLLCTVAIVCGMAADARVTLPQMFQDGMVVQRGKPIPVWGKADAGEKVSVTLEKKTFTTTAAADGHWRVDLPKMKAAGPLTLKVNDREIKDVWVGDVWLCSGQSNIDVTVERVYPWYTKVIDGYANTKVRLFRVQNTTDTHGVREDILPTKWVTATKENAWRFSAIGYFLGRRMFEKTGVAQGVIVNSWGGTPIEAWVSSDSLEQHFPMMVERTRLYQNDEYVRAQGRANMLINQQWSRQLDAREEKGEKGFRFTEANYDDSNWSEASQWSGDWARINGKPVVGSIWLRQHVNIDKAHAGQPARLLLGTLFDADVTYVNGVQVGSTGYQYPPRRYDIPEGLLKEGDNVIAVRFINKYGTAHFIREKAYLIAFGDDRFSLNPLPKDVIPLSTTWKHHAGVEMPSCPGADVSLQNLPTTLYNAVLYPLAPYALSGVVWYQGESNVGNPRPYEQLLTMMIENWRSLWQQPELPFVVCQLANYMAPSDQPQPRSGNAQIREAQRLAAKKLQHVALASAIDLGETVDIHPLRKREMADRIGICFDRLVYGNKKALLMPEITSVKVNGNEVRLTFDQPLRPSNNLFEFETAGTDGRFQNAQARTEGSNVIVITSTTDTPTKVRHAWKDNPIKLNAYAASGLPVGPFEQDL